MSNKTTMDDIARVILDLYNTGNRGRVSKSRVAEGEISEVQYKTYIGLIEEMHDHACAYVVAKHNPEGTEEKVLKAMRSKIFKTYKQILSTAKVDGKQIKGMTPLEHDIDDIVGFAQKLVRDSNNVNFEEKWNAKMVWACVPLKVFQKWVETALGIKLAQRAVLTTEEFDYLQAERKLVSRLKKDKAEVDEHKVALSKLSAELELVTEPAVKEYISKGIQSHKDKVRALEKHQGELYTAMGKLSETKPASLGKSQTYELEFEEVVTKKVEKTKAEKAKGKKAKVEKAKVEIALA